MQKAPTAHRRQELSAVGMESGLRFFRHNVHVLPIASAAGKLHDPVFLGEQRVVAASTHVVAGVKLGSPLPHDDTSRVYKLAAVGLDPEVTRVGVARVLGRPHGFLVSHNKPRSVEFTS